MIATLKSFTPELVDKIVASAIGTNLKWIYIADGTETEFYLTEEEAGLLIAESPIRVYNNLGRVLTVYTNTGGGTTVKNGYFLSNVLLLCLTGTEE